MEENFEKLLQEVANLREQLTTVSAKPTAPAWSEVLQPSAVGSGTNCTPQGRSHQPVRRHEEEMESKTAEKKWEKAMVGAVELYLTLEMHMKKEDLEKISIVKVFRPASDDWHTLYIELGSVEQAKFTLSFIGEWLGRGGPRSRSISPGISTIDSKP